jgi:hypothetical protein
MFQKSADSECDKECRDENDNGDRRSLRFKQGGEHRRQRSIPRAKPRDKHGNGMM